MDKYISYQIMKYMRPIWYFHLKPNLDKNNVWCNYDDLSKQDKKVINYDSQYSCEFLSNWDASYQALMKGVVSSSKSKYMKIDNVVILPCDIYHFFRKYHKRRWLFFVFFQRIIFLHNPIKECLGLYSTRTIKKINIFNSNLTYYDYNNYESLIIKSKPFVSIIIPTLNRYEHLGKLLNDIKKQSYKFFEVIIIDQSSPFNKSFYDRYNLELCIIRNLEPALWKARNDGIRKAKSDYILLLDDDSKISENWILEHLKCIDYFKADISSGISLSEVGSKIPENYSFFRHSDQLDTGNVLIRKYVFEKCGLFDESFEKMRMGDGEFGLRAYLNGFKNISNPKAYRDHLKLNVGGLREMGHWDGFRPKNIFSPRPIPSVLFLYRKYWGSEAAFWQILISIPFSCSPYYLKSTKRGYILSFTVVLLFFPIILGQLLKSIIISSQMLGKKSTIKNI